MEEKYRKGGREGKRLSNSWQRWNATSEHEMEDDEQSGNAKCKRAAEIMQGNEELEKNKHRCIQAFHVPRC